MTLLTLVNDALGEIALPPVASVTSTSNPRSPPLFSVAKAALDAVCDAYDWPYLYNTEPYTFNTVVAQQEYDLPDDFERIITDTVYDTTEDYKLYGGVTPAKYMWVNINNGLGDGKRFMVAGYGTNRKAVLTPAPDTVTTIAYFYKSNYKAVSGAGAAKATFDADDDLPRVPERLVRMEFKWRYLKQRGHDYGEEFREAKELAEKLFAETQNSPTVTLAGGRRPNMWPLTDGYVPDRGYGA